MRTSAILLGITILVSASAAVAQVPQPPPGTMSPSEIPPGFAAPPGVELKVLTPPLPPPPAPPPPKRPVRSVGMMAAGIVFVSIGATAFISGIAYMAVANGRCPPAQTFCAMENTLWGLLAMHGGVMVGVGGGVLLGKGASRGPEPERSPWTAPSISVGLGSASLQWTF